MSKKHAVNIRYQRGSNNPTQLSGGHNNTSGNINKTDGKRQIMTGDSNEGSGMMKAQLPSSQKHSQSIQAIKEASDGQTMGKNEKDNQSSKKASN